jgi:PAS domain S-box-containing protein
MSQSASTTEVVPNVPTLSIIVTDAGGKIVSYSEGAEKMFGWKPSEVVGKSVAMMHTEEGVKQFGKVLGDAANGRYDGDLDFNKKNGQKFKGHLQVVATKDRQGRISSYIGITTEV